MQLAVPQSLGGVAPRDSVLFTVSRSHMHGFMSCLAVDQRHEREGSCIPSIEAHAGPHHVMSMWSFLEFKECHGIQEFKEWQPH
jgi:hypothetical protein